MGDYSLQRTASSAFIHRSTSQPNILLTRTYSVPDLSAYYRSSEKYKPQWPKRYVYNPYAYWSDQNDYWYDKHSTWRRYYNPSYYTYPSYWSYPYYSYIPDTWWRRSYLNDWGAPSYPSYNRRTYPITHYSVYTSDLYTRPYRSYYPKNLPDYTFNYSYYPNKYRPLSYTTAWV
uniref:Uncharacterized protein n=1 Tax=Acrobeloides nanus TaxID=290746 RepID=A0A914DAK6_9BILA